MKTTFFGYLHQGQLGQMLYATLFVLVTLHLSSVYSSEVKNDTCHTQGYCSHLNVSSSISEIDEQSSEISECLNSDANFEINVNDSLLQSLKCVVTDIRNKLDARAIRNIFQDINVTNSSFRSYKCLYCALIEFYLALQDFEQVNATTELLERYFTTIVFLNHFQNTSGSDWLHSFLDIDTWKSLLYTLANNTIDLDKIRIEVDETVRKKQLKNENICGFGEECVYRPIIWILFLISVFGNSLLIFIFIRHKEIRSVRNTIILNLAVADLLSVVFNACLQVLFVYGNSYSEVAVKYLIINVLLELTTSACIYSVVALSIQRYLALSMTSSFCNCEIPRRINSSVFISVLWILAVANQVLDVTIHITPRAWVLRNVIVMCVIPSVVIAIFYVMTSVKLRRSAKTIPGEGTSQETARYARLRSSNVLLALIVVFIISYTPLQLFRLIDIWFYSREYVFDYVDFISYCLLSLNSIFNPVALFTTSASFRCYFELYVCRRNITRDGSISRTDTKMPFKNGSALSLKIKQDIPSISNST